MQDKYKTKAQLIAELAELRARLAELETAEAGFAERDGLYRRIVETANEGIWVVDADYRTTYVNDKLVQMLGYQPQEMLRQPAADFVHPGDLDDRQERIARRRRGQKEEFERRWLHKDGHTVWGLIKATPMFDAQGRFAGSFSLVTDITERKRTEQALRLTQFSMDSAAVEIFWITPTGYFIYVNDAACAKLGYSRQELLGMSVADVDPDYPADARAEHWEKFKKAQVMTFETRHRAKDGTIFPVEITSHYLEFEGQEYEFAFVTDISERQKTLERLRQQEERFTKVFQASPLWVTISTLDDGVYLEVNDAFSDITGYTRQEALGKTSGQIGVWADSQRRREAVKVIKREGSLRDFHIDYRTKDGQIRHALWSAEVVDLEGRACLISVLRDITERLKAQQALVESEERFRAQFLSLPHSTLIWEHDGQDLVLVEANPAAHEYPYSDIGKLYGNTARDLWRDWPEVWKAINRCYQERKTVTVEMPRYTFRSTGQTRHILLTFSYAPPRFVFDYLEDITEREEAERALRRSEANYHTIFNSVNDMIVVHDAGDGRPLDANDRILKVLGYEKDEFLALQVEDWSADEGPFGQKEALARIHRAAQGQPRVFEWHCQKKDGQRFWVEVNLTKAVILDRDVVLAVVRDISERKAAQQALVESEERFRTHYQDFPHPIFIWEHDGSDLVLREANPAAHQATREGVRQFIGAKAQEFWSDEPELVQAIERCFAQRQMVTLEVPAYLSRATSRTRHIIFTFTFAPPRHVFEYTQDLTERKAAEQALEKSEATLQSIFRTAPVGLGLLTDRVINWGNEQLSQITGYSARELVGQDARMLYDSEQEYQRVGKVRQAQIEREGAGTVETRWRRKDGQVIDIQLSSAAIDPQDSSAGAVFSAVDITESKRARQALEESENKYRTLFEGMSDAVFIHDLEGRFLEANRAACERLGYRRQEFLSMGVMDIDTPENARLAPQRLAEVQKKGRLVFEGAHVTRQGAVMPVEIHVNMIEYQGQPAVLSVVRDITERRQSEEALRQSEARYRGLFEHMLNGFAYHRVVTDEQGRPVDGVILEVNKTFGQATGLKAEDIIGKRLSEVFPGIEKLEFDWIGTYGRVALSGEPAYFEQYFSLHDKWYSVSVYSPAPEHFACVFVDITERKRSEEALRQSERRFRALFEWAPVAVAVLNSDYQVVRVNAEFTALFGYGQSEATGRNIYDLVVPAEDRQRAMEHGRGVARGLRPQFEGERIRKDGSRVYVHISSRQIEAGRQEKEFYVTYQDMTERRRAKQALTQSEARYHELFNNMSAGVAIYEAVQDGQDFVFKDLNRAGERITQQSKRQVIGRRVSEAFPGVRDLGLLEVFQRVWRSGRPEHHPTSRYQDQRRSMWMENFVCKLPTGEVVAIFDDITQRKRVEDSLQWELFVNAALASMSHAMISNEADLDSMAKLVLRYAKQITGSEHGFVSSIDPETGANLGHALSQMKGEECSLKEAGQRVFFLPNPDGVYPGLWGHCLNTRESFYSNTPRDHPSAQGLPEGHLGLRNFLSVPVLFASQLMGQIALANAHRAYTQQDVMAVEQLAELFALALHRRRAEEERDKLQAQLRQTQKMEAIGTLAGGIAHDFNNVLAAILGFTELTLDMVPAHGQARDNLDQVLKAGQRARDLVQQILSFSRQSDQEQKPVEIGLIIKEALKLLRASLPATIEIETSLEDTRDKVRADPVQIHQLMMNLCANAAQAMPEGGLLRVELSPLHLDEQGAASYAGLEPGRYLRLSVSDTGLGMDRQTMERIFEPFFTTKEPGQGTGMGLSVVHGVVQSHGGTITVYSEPGQGTTFKVYLPVLEDAEWEEAAGPPEPLPGGQERVLFVDDEPTLTDVAQRTLESLGYRVTALTSSQEALELLQAQPEAFDLLITDYTMPRLTGIALAQEISKIRPDLPIIMCTGFSGQLSPRRFKQMGIKRLLIKPLVSRELAQAVRRVLDEAQGPGGGEAPG